MREKNLFWRKKESTKYSDRLNECGDSNYETSKRNDQIACLKALAEGNLIFMEQYHFSEEDDFDQSLLKLAETISKMQKDINLMFAADDIEKFDSLNTLELYPGVFQEIMVAVNQENKFGEDSFISIINALKLMGNGEIPQLVKVSDKKNISELQVAVNALINSFNSFNELNDTLNRMSMNDYSKSAEGEFKGIYNDLKESINILFGTNTWIINAFKHLAIGDVQNDLERMKMFENEISEKDEFIPSIIKAMSNIILLLTETQDMLEAAINGDLNYRIDISKFEGEYIKIVSGFNQCIDTITEPIKEASGVLSGLSQGNLETHMMGDYSGDNGKIKTDLNVTIDFLKKYILEITNVLQRIGSGDLKTKIDGEFNGDFSAIKIALTEITVGLNRIISEIGKSAEMVEVGAKQISLASQDLAEGSSKQASSVEELSASMEEISEKTKRSADNASQVNQLTKTMYERANAGNNLMMELVGAIGDINESSKSISKIIKVIDDIAFQTNILALNAAVEAARAGEHGKGFSVVAEEVRVLASKSADAARQTNELIDQSVERAKVGTSMADNTAIRLKEMLEQIEKTTELVDEIAVSSVEQVTEFDEIRKGIEEVSSVVQRNAATAQESAASSQELFAQSNLLKKAVEQFML